MFLPFPGKPFQRRLVRLNLGDILNSRYLHLSVDPLAKDSPCAPPGILDISDVRHLGIEIPVRRAEESDNIQRILFQQGIQVFPVFELGCPVDPHIDRYPIGILKLQCCDDPFPAVHCLIPHSFRTFIDQVDLVSPVDIDDDLRIRFLTKKVVCPRSGG